MNLNDLVNQPKSSDLARLAKKRFGRGIDVDSISESKARELLAQFDQKIKTLENLEGERVFENKRYHEIKLAHRALQQKIDEAAKPDYLDLDKDGDKKEPMKKAAKDAKKKKKTNESIGDDIQRTAEKLAQAAGKKTAELMIKIATDAKEKFPQLKGKDNVVGGAPQYQHELVSFLDNLQKEVDIAIAEKSIDGFERRSYEYMNNLKELGMDRDVHKLFDRIEAVLEESAGKKTNKGMIKEDIATAQVTMAAQDMVDRIQGMLEDVGEMLNEDLPPLADSIRNELGANTAESFSASAEAALNSALEALRNTREQLDSANRQMSGEEAPSDTMGAEEPAVDMDMDLGGEEPPEEDGFGASDAAAGGEEPMGREKAV